MRHWIWIVAACGPASPPQPMTPRPVSVDAGPPVDGAGPGDAGPIELERREVGPVIDGLQGRYVLQDHELTLRTPTVRVTLAGGAAVDVAPIDDPARRVAGPDGTWSVEQDYKNTQIVMVEGTQRRRVAGRYGSTLIEFTGALEKQRTVVLDRGNVGWSVVRSQDGGRTWAETTYTVVGSAIVSSRRTLDLVSSDGHWIRIDREGEVTTSPMLAKAGEPTATSCAAANLWIARGKHVLWFDTKTGGNVTVTARGPLTCAGEAVLVPVDNGLVRCTHAGCGQAVAAGEFADLTANGIATATQREKIVRVVRSDGPTVDVALRDGEKLVGMAVWGDVPTLVLLGTTKKLEVAAVR